MKRMGVRESKARWGAILDEVSRDGEIIEITKYGAVIARIVPVRSPQDRKRNVHATLTDLETLRAEVSGAWPKGVSVQDVIDDIRS